MGGCSSRVSRSECETAKVILSDSTLTQYGEHIKAEEIIRLNPDHFLCDSDSMCIDRYMVAVDPEEELEMGQLYFLLPLRKLQYVLSVSDMGEMLGRAISAMRSTGYQYNWRFPITYPKEKPDRVAGGLGVKGSVRKPVFGSKRLETIHET